MFGNKEGRPSVEASCVDQVRKIVSKLELMFGQEEMSKALSRLSMSAPEKFDSGFPPVSNALVKELERLEPWFTLDELNQALGEVVRDRVSTKGD